MDTIFFFLRSFLFVHVYGTNPNRPAHNRWNECGESRNATDCSTGHGCDALQFGDAPIGRHGSGEFPVSTALQLLRRRPSGHHPLPQGERLCFQHSGNITKH